MSLRANHSLKVHRYSNTAIADELAGAGLLSDLAGEYVKVDELRKKLIDLQKQGKLSEDTRVRIVTLLGLAG